MTLKRKPTAIIYSPHYLLHDPGPDHPESPMRLKAIVKELRKNGFTQRDELKRITPTEASVDQIQSVHAKDYVDLVKRTRGMKQALLDAGDTVTCPKSYRVALLAAGGTIQAADSVMSEESKNSFALVRPPGHHAGVDYAFGFCIFNNVALAATHLLLNHRLKRVAIVDIDGHHGNGTQEIFYKTNTVLYTSLHSDPRSHFPGTGHIEEIGEGAGIGYNIDVPLPSGTDDALYQEALGEIILPIIRQYNPEFILVSAGFDSHYADPILDLSLTANGYRETVHKIIDLSEECCQGKLSMTLEGGYNLPYLARMVTATIAQMGGLDYAVKDDKREANSTVVNAVRRTIRELRTILSSYWKL